MLALAGLLILASPPRDAEVVRQAYLEGRARWWRADYIAETSTEMWLFLPGDAMPFSLRWRTERVSWVRRRDTTWRVNITDVTDQDGRQVRARYGFASDDRFLWYSDHDGDLRGGIGPDNPRSRRWSIGARGATAIFEGLLPSNGADVAELLRMAGSPTVVDDGESVPGYRTLRIQAQKPGMSVHLWVAPDLDHQLVRLQVLLGATPENAELIPEAAGTEVTVGQPIVRYDVMVEDVEFGSIHEDRVITRASVTEQWLYQNGAVVRYLHDASRREVNLDPAPFDDRLGLDIPEGAVIQWETPGGPAYHWRDDRLVLTIDAGLYSLVEWAIGFVRTSLAQGGAVGERKVEFAEPQGSSANNPYCGIFSLYGAARLLDRAIDLRALVNERYVSTPEGSSIQNLLDAAAAHGLHARALGKLSIDGLLATDRPVVLHVRRDPGVAKPDHFVLFCPTPNGTGAIVDMPHGAYPLDEYDLSNHWDGVGIVVSDRAMAASRWPGRIALAGAAILLAVAAGRWWHRRHNGPTAKVGVT